MENKEKARLALESFCTDIELWFRGGEANREELSKRILSGFSADFEMVSGDGNRISLDSFITWLPTVYGIFPDRRVFLENIEIACSQDHALATYVEIQSTRNTTTRRRSSAVFLIKEEKALWFHLIEHWL